MLETRRDVAFSGKNRNSCNSGERSRFRKLEIEREDFVRTEMADERSCIGKFKLMPGAASRLGGDFLGYQLNLHRTLADCHSSADPVILAGNPPLPETLFHKTSSPTNRGDRFLLAET